MNETNRILSDVERETLMVQAAKLYYELDQTQAEIAREMGLTRWQVGRLLRDARDIGIVRIEIVPRSSRLPLLESALQSAYPLRDAVVVPTPENDGLARDVVAKAAAQYLNLIHPKPKHIGVSWGRTMTTVASYLVLGWNEGVHIVLMNGATSHQRTGAGMQTNNVAEQMAVVGPGTASLLPVPAILGERSTRIALEQDPVVSTVMEQAISTPVAIFGLGMLTPQSVLVESGYINENDINRLREMGAVGDVLSRYIDVNGAIVDHDLDERTLGLRLSQLAEKEMSIGVAAGAAKHKVVRGALAARLVNVLIVDETIASRLLL